MNLKAHTALLGILTIGPSFGAVIFYTSPSGVIDTTKWSQLGSDQTLLASTFSATSTLGVGVSVNLAGSGGGLVSVVCAPVNPTNCSWTPAPPGYNPGDSLIWAENATPAGTGPISFSFASQFGAGAWFESTFNGTYTGQLQVYNGNTLLGTQTVTSTGSAQTSSTPVFLEAVSDSKNITKAVFSVTSCTNPFGVGTCDAKDFSINTLDFATTPEPATIAPVLTGLVALGLFWKKRHSAGTVR